MNTPQKMLGIKIRELRLQQGISQESLADLTGLHRTYIGSVERGERNISLNNIIEIAKALKTTPSILLENIQ
jgi:transcriptional regulator with XRE-family HTH domain